MKEPKQYAEQAKERQTWAGCDPLTLVLAAREGLHEIQNGGDGRPSGTEIAGPLDEVISRFEAQTRASFGASAPLVSGSQLSLSR